MSSSIATPLRFLVAVAAATLIALPLSCSGGGTSGTGGSDAGHTASTSSSSSLSSGGGGSAGSGGSGGGDAGRPSDPAIVVDLQDRAYDLLIPPGYDASKPAPLLVMLHDLSASASPWSDVYASMHLGPTASMRNIVVALARGSLDPASQRYFWNATDACCDYGALGTNDVGYVMALIADVSSQLTIDPKRVFVVGHGNGGFMAHRLACDQADKVAGIVSVGGAVYADASKCAASAPVAVLNVHGDADFVAPYPGGVYAGAPDGGAALQAAPGAMATIQTWRLKNGCAPKADVSQPAVDYADDLVGAETKKIAYGGCEANGGTELWTLHLGGHDPVFNDAWANAVLDFLMAHPRP